MAKVCEKQAAFYLVYEVFDPYGRRHEQWEKCESEQDAQVKADWMNGEKPLRERHRKYEEGEYRLRHKNPDCYRKFLEDFVEFYGKENWSVNVYAIRVAMIREYINPMLGDMKVKDISKKILDLYYQKLPEIRTSRSYKCRSKKDERVSPRLIHEIHKIISKSFELALRWEMIEKDPTIGVILPTDNYRERPIWSEQEVGYALSICEDEYLSLLMNLMFACTLRTGEALGLTWDCVDTSEQSQLEGTCHIRIDKSLQSVSTAALEEVKKSNVQKKFINRSENSKQTLVLKNPKTKAGKRLIYLPQYLVEKLETCKMHQKFEKEVYGPEYIDHNMIFVSGKGNPLSRDWMIKKFYMLVEKENLPKVQLYSLRHSSITYKLRISHGDIKSVQGDAGHARAELVKNRYSHIQDEDRKRNAKCFQKAFYEEMSNDEKI